MAYSYIDNDVSVLNLYQLVDSYFNSPILEKVKDDPIRNLSVYMCKIATLLGGADQRYLVVTCNMDDRIIGTRLKLENIEWKSFQTRTISPPKGSQSIPEYQHLPKHSYLPKNESDYLIPIHLIQRHEDHTEYQMDGYPNCAITLLHRTKNIHEFAERGSLASAFETFRTVLVLKY